MISEFCYIVNLIFNRMINDMTFMFYNQKRSFLNITMNNDKPTRFYAFLC